MYFFFFFLNPGCIVSVLPDPVPAGDHDSASLPGAHLRHSATRGVSGAEAQSPLPAVCVSVLSVLQVSRSIWAVLCRLLSVNFKGVVHPKMKNTYFSSYL